MMPILIMIFEENRSLQKIGEIVGFICMYLLFTTILFFILVLLDKIPSSWSYFHIMAITFLIALIGAIIKRFLK